MVRRQNEGSFGCEAVARAFGQPNVPECAVGFHFLCLYAAKISLSFCRMFLSFYNERQRTELYAVADCGRFSCRAAPPLLRATRLVVSTETAIDI